MSSGGSGARSQDSDIVAATSSDAGVSWTDPTDVNENASTDSAGDWAPQLATDALGQWLAVWESTGVDRPATATPDLDILARRSMDDGASWVNQTPVNTDATTDTASDFNPAIATDKLGTWIAVWSSTDTLGNTIGDDNDLFFSRSTDDGATWSTSAPLNTTAPFDTATTPPNAVNGVSGTAVGIAAGYFHSCAIQTGTGIVVCWGEDGFGQSTPPDAVNGVSGTASAVFAGYYHTCAIQAGTSNVVCWGDNGSGQATPPSAVNGVSGTATEVAGGLAHTCAIQAGTGNVVCWGDNSFGQATPPSSVNGVSGGATRIATGALHSCAVQAGTGNVVCWGENGIGQASPPGSVNGTSGTATDIAAGAFHSCAIQAGTGGVVCWGDDTQNSDDQTVVPFSVGGTGGSAAQISARDNYNCSIQSGTDNVICWGSDFYTQSTPPDAVDGTSGTAAAIAAGFFHACAIQSGTGVVVCWGQYGFSSDVQPQIATDGLGNWVAVWTSNYALGETIGRDGDILVSISSDDGFTWSDPSALNSNAATDRAEGNTVDEDQFPTLTTDYQGVWLASWTSLSSPGPPINDDLFFARSLNAGATWSTRARLNTDGRTDQTQDRESSVATDGAGNWVAAWYSLGTPMTSNGRDGDIQTARSSDGGVTWTAPMPLNTNATTDTGADRTPQVAYGTGQFIAVWSSEEDLGGILGPDADILFARSSDLGATWTPPAALNTDATGDEDPDLVPQLTTDGMGQWIAIWQQGNPL